MWAERQEARQTEMKRKNEPKYLSVASTFAPITRGTGRMGGHQTIENRHSLFIVSKGERVAGACSKPPKAGRKKQADRIQIGWHQRRTQAVSSLCGRRLYNGW